MNKRRSLGKTILVARIDNDISQRKLAKKVGISCSYLSQIENDKVPTPSNNILIDIAEALQIDLEELLHALVVSEGGILTLDEKANRLLNDFSDRTNEMFFFEKANSLPMGITIHFVVNGREMKEVYFFKHGQGPKWGLSSCNPASVSGRKIMEMQTVKCMLSETTKEYSKEDIEGFLSRNPSFRGSKSDGKPDDIE